MQVSFGLSNMEQYRQKNDSTHALYDCALAATPPPANRSPQADQSLMNLFILRVVTPNSRISSEVGGKNHCCGGVRDVSVVNSQPGIWVGKGGVGEGIFVSRYSLDRVRSCEWSLPTHA